MTFSASRGQKRDADAGGQKDLMLVELEGAAHLRENRACQMRDGSAVVRIRRQSVDEQRELVACKASDDGVFRQRARETLGQHLEQPVPGGMAEGVVHLLEPVHVQIQQRDHRAAAQAAGDRLLQQMLELHAVRDLGERIVAGEVADAPLGTLALGDVARDEDARPGTADRRFRSASR